MTKLNSSLGYADHCPMCLHKYEVGDPKEQDEHLSTCKEALEFCAQVEEEELRLKPIKEDRMIWRLTDKKFLATNVLAHRCSACGHVYQHGDESDQDDHLSKCQKFRDFMLMVEAAELLSRQNGRVM